MHAQYIGKIIIKNKAPFDSLSLEISREMKNCCFNGCKWSRKDNLAVVYCWCLVL